MLFKAHYAFCSNFHGMDRPIRLRAIKDGEVITVLFWNVETAYHACTIPQDNFEARCSMAKMSPAAAKKAAKLLKRPADWATKRLAVMRALVWAKFSQNPDLAAMLLATAAEERQCPSGPCEKCGGTGVIVVCEELVEHNWWHDNFWGHCQCDGCKDEAHHNWLGKILMEVRDRLKNGPKSDKKVEEAPKGQKEEDMSPKTKEGKGWKCTACNGTGFWRDTTKKCYRCLGKGTMGIKDVKRYLANAAQRGLTDVQLPPGVSVDWESRKISISDEAKEAYHTGIGQPVVQPKPEDPDDAKDYKAALDIVRSDVSVTGKAGRLANLIEAARKETTPEAPKPKKARKPRAKKKEPCPSCEGHGEVRSSLAGNPTDDISTCHDCGGKGTK